MYLRFVGFRAIPLGTVGPTGSQLRMTRLAAISAVSVILWAPLAAAQSAEAPGSVRFGGSGISDESRDADGASSSISTRGAGILGSTTDGPFLRLSPGVGSIEVRGSVISGDGQRKTRSLLGSWEEPGDPAFSRADAGDTGDPSYEVNTFVGYDVQPGGNGRETIGINLHVAAEVAGGQDGWLLQPGIDYTAPLSKSIQAGARLFSTYTSEDYGGASFAVRDPERAAFDRSDPESGFRDVGLGVNLGYSLSESWLIETQAGYSRMIGDATRKAAAEDKGTANEFFGGVIVNYRF
jgi:hypothetical protein